MTRISAVLARAGGAVAVLASAALIGAPTAAHAADDRPDLSVSFDRDPVAEIDNSGQTVGVYVSNYGGAAATAVTLTLDLSKLGDDVVATVPEWSEQCELAGSTVTCAVGDLDPGQYVALRRHFEDGTEDRRYTPDEPEDLAALATEILS